MMMTSPKTFALLAALLTTGAQAAITAEFSGAAGTVLSMTLVDPISYTMSGSGSPSGFTFIFQGVTATGPYNSSVASGDITISLNDGPEETAAIFFVSRGAQNGDVTPVDLILQVVLFSSLSYLPGDVITLSAGSVTTGTSISAALAEGTSFNSFLVDSSWTRASTDAVPEPGAAALLGLGAAGFFLRRRRTA